MVKVAKHCCHYNILIFSLEVGCGLNEGVLQVIILETNSLVFASLVQSQWVLYVTMFQIYFV